VLRFLGHFFLDLVLSAAQVAWQTIRLRAVGQSAIIRVQMRSDSDLLLTIVAESLTLVPGSVVIDMDRGERTLSLHILHVRDLADVERRRAAVLAEEERVVRAFGSTEEIVALAHAPGVMPAGTGRGTP
jgi:multicomponent Na+:H+ antiporter subunit E